MYEYMEYAILDITVKNANDDLISIDTKEKIKTIYLYDERSMKYEAFLNENESKTLQVKKNVEKNIKIKFSKIYNPENITISGVKFKDVVLNYENYIEGTEEKNKIEFDINI